MTARPIDPECRRRPFSIMVALVLVMVAVVLAAGCINQTMIINTILQRSVNQTPVITQMPESPPITGPSGTLCPPENETPYIIINPIGTHKVGDKFEISGATNLGVDEKIIFDLREPLLLDKAPAPNTTATQYYQYFGASGYVKIRNGFCDTNYWSFPVDLSGYHSDRKYYVNVWDKSNPSIKNATDFLIYFDR